MCQRPAPRMPGESSALATAPAPGSDPAPAAPSESASSPSTERYANNPRPSCRPTNCTGRAHATAPNSSRTVYAGRTRCRTDASPARYPRSIATVPATTTSHSRFRPYPALREAETAPPSAPAPGARHPLIPREMRRACHRLDSSHLLGVGVGVRYRRGHAGLRPLHEAAALRQAERAR